MYPVLQSPCPSLHQAKPPKQAKQAPGRENKTYGRKKIIPPTEDADPQRVYKHRIAQLMEDLFQQLKKGWQTTLEISPQQVKRFYPLEEDATIDRIFKRTIQQLFIYEQICSDLEAQIDIRKGMHPAEGPKPVPSYVYSRFCQQLSMEERAIIMPHCVIAQTEEWLRKETT